MCGISGIAPLKANKSKFLESLPILMEAIKHRGPDDEGCSFFSEKNILCTFGNDTPENVKNSQLPYSPIAPTSNLDDNYFLGLGHRRLSIIDLSEYGHQPMCDKSENYWMVYNGEIYNYQSLKIELEKLGHQFITQTDTEVLLNAYIEWGEECLTKLNGMWSFVIFNRKKNELFGKVFETFMVLQLQAEFFWRDQYKNEVDIINVKDDKILPLEIKLAKIDPRPLGIFMKKFKLNTGIIISYNKKEQLRLDGKSITIIPYYEYLLTEGR